MLKTKFFPLISSVVFSFFLVSCFSTLTFSRQANKADKKNVKSKSTLSTSDSIKAEIQARINKFVNPFVLFDTEKETDSVFAYYTFEKGDTLEYIVQSSDSIIIDYDEPLLKIRSERYVIICDSVGLNNHYYLTYYLKDFLGKESKGDIQNIERSESRWIEKKVFLEIDSTGERFNVSAADTTSVAIAPGGNFQPTLIYPLGNALKSRQETWLINGKLDLIENGYPYAELKATTLHRMRGVTDTLGFKTIRVDYVRTGTGDVVHKSKNNAYLTNCVINSHGEMYIDPLVKKPTHLFVTIEQKLRFSDESGDSKVGKQFTNSYFTLFSFNNYDKMIKKLQK